jgi:ubiquinone/menaquinone biosynthesis C-methylase UbiE
MDIVERLLPRNSGRVLDVGCGDVNVKGLLYCHNRLQKKYDVLGIDLNPGERKNVLKASALQIPFADQSIEYVVSFDVIEHIKEFYLVIKEMLRVSSRRVIIIVPTTSAPIVRKVVNVVRRMMGGSESKLGKNLLQGHYYEFFPEDIFFFKGNAFSISFYRIDFPLLGKSFLHRSGLLYAGIYVFDRK